MLKFHAHKFVDLSAILSSISVMFMSSGTKFEDAEKGLLRNELPRAISLLDEFGLSMSSKKARLVLTQVDKPYYNAAHFSVSIDELKERIKDELEERYCLCLDAVEAMLFAPTQSLVGAQVEANFPSILYEIEESAKCGALGRDTASAFHAIRCLEAAIRAISRCLKIADPTKASQRSWFNMLKEIKEASDKRWPNAKDKFSGDGQLFEEFHGALSGMQNPYRNATMHLDAKYSRPEAEVIRIMVREFLAKVASRMNEEGEPKLP